MSEPASDTPALRKARGAFFTPALVSQFMVRWAVREPSDRVLEPSAGDAAFLVPAVQRLRALGRERGGEPRVHGVEIHPASARAAEANVRAAGGSASIMVSDFFLVEPEPSFDVVVGNPPFIRYQDFGGASRARSREAALKAGVALTALASSWAAFTIHSALFLKQGGRMALVLPAELLSVNYASVVRKFLFDNFSNVELVLFAQQVFADAEADVVLLLAEGFREGSADHAKVYQADSPAALELIGSPARWSPQDPSSKWTGLLVDPEAINSLHGALDAGKFATLEEWGDTTLGMVTGNNKYFALSPDRVEQLGLEKTDLVRLSPPGSTHLRGLALTTSMMRQLDQEGRSTWLFSPKDELSDAASQYVEAGQRAGVDSAYKCRIRQDWFRVPLLRPADLLLTCMNADTPRLTTNSARVRHLNSIHGIYLSDPLKEVGLELLPLASINSLTMLSAEMVGRSYGGGVLKIEPREADVWAVPSHTLIVDKAEELRSVKTLVAKRLSSGDLASAVDLVDQVLLVDGDVIDADAVAVVREARDRMALRRTERGRRGR